MARRKRIVEGLQRLSAYHEKVMSVARYPSTKMAYECLLKRSTRDGVPGSRFIAGGAKCRA